MKITSIIAYVLVLIGAIVWGLIGIFDINLVSLLFGAGATAMVSRIIYTLVGLAGVWLIIFWAVCKPFQSVD